MTMDMNDPVTRERHVQEVRAAFELMKAVADAIRDIDAHRNGEGIPNGELYAQLMGHFSYQTYTAMISKFKEMGLISEKNNVIRWIGPKKEA